MLSLALNNFGRAIKLLLITVGFSVLTLGGFFALSILIIPPSKIVQQNNPESIPVLELPEIAPASTPAPEPVTIMFVGDMMFDRHIRSNAEKQGNYDFILEPMKEKLAAADLIVGNLEGPITNNKSRSQGSIPGSSDNYFFTFDPAILTLLQTYPFVVNLGNNHITNFNNDGIDQTIKFLTDSKITYFGQIGRDAETESTIWTNGNLKIALINYNEFIPGGLPKTIADIQKLKTQADLVIVYTHWGTEYVPVANSVITGQAHSFVDAGADLVIGSHPHVIQNSEIYNGVPIYYSLGNFIFDQYFSKEVQTGQVVTALIDPESQKISTSEQLVTLEKTGVTSPVVLSGQTTP